MLQQVVESVRQVDHGTVGLHLLHKGHDVHVLQACTLVVGEVSFERQSRRDVDAAVAIAHDDHQSAVAAPHAVAVAHVLRHAERVIVLNVIDHGNGTLYVQLLVEAAQRLVHDRYRRVRQDAVGVGHVLRLVVEMGHGNRLGIPHLVGGRLVALGGHVSHVVHRQGTAETACHAEATAHNERRAPELPDAGRPLGRQLARFYRLVQLVLPTVIIRCHEVVQLGNLTVESRLVVHLHDKLTLHLLVLDAELHNVGVERLPQLIDSIDTVGHEARPPVLLLNDCVTDERHDNHEDDDC